MTGHQGEPDAILTRIANGETQFRIDKGDKVIFSANAIPNPMTLANRYALETKLKWQGRASMIMSMCQVMPRAKTTGTTANG